MIKYYFYNQIFLNAEKSKRGLFHNYLCYRGIDVTKGLPWTVEEEIQLKVLVEAQTPVYEMAAKLGRHPRAIIIKCQRLGIEIDDEATIDQLPVPDELPSVEAALKKLAGALEAASEPGINRVEIQRLRLIAALAQSYKEILADFLNYQEIENKLKEMEEKYAISMLYTISIFSTKAIEKY